MKTSLAVADGKDQAPSVRRKHHRRLERPGAQGRPGRQRQDRSDGSARDVARARRPQGTYREQGGERSREQPGRAPEETSPAGAAARRGRRRCDLRLRQRVLDLDPRVGDVVEAARRVLLEAPAQKNPNPLRRFRRQLVPVGLRLEDGGQRVGDRVAAERLPAGQALEEHATEGEDVGALVEGPPTSLLGAHVRGGAQDDAGLRSGGQRGRPGQVPEAPLPAMSGRASPKSSTLTEPSERTMTLAGFRSR